MDELAVARRGVEAWTEGGCEAPADLHRRLELELIRAADRCLHLDALARLAGAVGPLRSPLVIAAAEVGVTAPDLARLRAAAEAVTTRPRDRELARPRGRYEQPGQPRAYLERWHLRRDPGPSTEAMYLHRVLRSDVDPPHDHPWASASILLAGTLLERVWTAPGLGREYRHEAGAIVLRTAVLTHLLERESQEPPLTLVATGPREQDWAWVQRDGRRELAQREGRA